MGSVFDGALAFNQPLDAWDVAALRGLISSWRGSTGGGLLLSLIDRRSRARDRRDLGADVAAAA